MIIERRSEQQRVIIDNDDDKATADDIGMLSGTAGGPCMYVEGALGRYHVNATGTHSFQLFVTVLTLR